MASFLLNLQFYGVCDLDCTSCNRRWSVMMGLAFFPAKFSELLQLLLCHSLIYKILWLSSQMYNIPKILCSSEFLFVKIYHCANAYMFVEDMILCITRTWKIVIQQFRSSSVLWLQCLLAVCGGTCTSCNCYMFIVHSVRGYCVVNCL